MRPLAGSGAEGQTSQQEPCRVGAIEAWRRSARDAGLSLAVMGARAAGGIAYAEAGLAVDDIGDEAALEEAASHWRGDGGDERGFSKALGHGIGRLSLNFAMFRETILFPLVRPTGR